MDEKTIARFWSKVDKRGPDECWLWTGLVFVGGYGRLGEHKAHRIAAVLCLALDPASELIVCHRCDNPPCCNPAHLFLGTHADNMRDKAAKNRAARNYGPCEKRRHTHLNVDQALSIRERRAAGESLAALAAEFGINKFHASKVARGLTGSKRILPPSDVSDILERLARGEKHAEIAVVHRISRQHVGSIASGHRGARTT